MISKSLRFVKKIPGNERLPRWRQPSWAYKHSGRQFKFVFHDRLVVIIVRAHPCLPSLSCFCRVIMKIPTCYPSFRFSVVIYVHTNTLATKIIGRLIER